MNLWQSAAGHGRKLAAGAEEKDAPGRRRGKEKIAGLVVNFQTEDAIRESVEAFRLFYPKMQLFVIDNSAFDESSGWLIDFAADDGNTTIVLSNTNLGHGPAMHCGLTLLQARGSSAAFVFDSDTVVVRPSLVEAMLKRRAGLPYYGVGTVVRVDRGGVCVAKPRGIPYLHPRCMLLNLSRYFDFPPFHLHGCRASWR